MKNTLLRAGALSCALLASTALTTPALAQSAPPPRFNQVDSIQAVSDAGDGKASGDNRQRINNDRLIADRNKL